MSVSDYNPAKARTVVDEIIGRNLRAIRLHRQVSQERLGNEVGVSFQSIQRYEQGLNRISLARAVQLADALNCGVMDLLKGVTDGGSRHELISQICKVSDQKILHAYQAIACPKQRQALLDLARTLANAED